VTDPGASRDRMPDLAPDAADDVAVVAKGGLIQIVGQVTHRTLAFLFTVVAVRAFGPAGFGLYQVIVQLLEFLSQLGLLGFNYAAMRFIARARALGDPAAVRGTIRVSLTSTAITSGVIVAVVVAAAGPIADAFGGSTAQQERFASLLRLGILFVPFFACMQVYRYATQAYKTMVPSVWVGNVLQPLLRLIILLGLLLGGVGVSAAVAGDVISMGIAAVVAVYVFRRVLTEEERDVEAWAEARPIVRFALPQSGSALLGLQALGLGVILLGLLSSNEQAGLFAIALALQGPADLTLSGIANIWAPMVTDLYDQGQIGRLDSLYKTITRWIATAALPVSAAMVIEAELFARILGGDKAVDAAPIVAILAIGNVFHTCTGPAASVLSMSGRPGINFIDSLVAVAIYALLGWLVIPEHGAVGMAWVHSAVTATLNITRVIQSKLLVRVQPFGRSLLKPAVATLFGVAAVLAWKLPAPDGVAFSVAGLVIGSGVYLAVLRVFGVDAEERYVWELLKARATRVGRVGSSDVS
jgi:O-antigen/teichoic acid export membrane protein